MANIPQTPVPEAPKEVVIRTLASDLELMAKSGGMFTAQPRRPAAVYHEQNQGAIPVKPAAEPVKTSAGLDQSFLIKIAIFGGGGIIVLGLLALAGYYLLPVVFPPETAPAATPTLPVEQPVLPKTESLPSPVFNHQSFFRTPADQTIAIALEPAAEAAALQTFGQQITEALAGTDPNFIFFEIALSGADSQPLSWTKFLPLANIQLLAPDFFLKNFNQDFTAFVYKDKHGAWPGYILELTGGQTPLLFQSQIAKIENDPSALSAFYPDSPGAAAGKFQDGQLVGEPIRFLNFSRSGAAFTYGWFHGKYLVFSTSLDGLKAAVNRL